MNIINAQPRFGYTAETNTIYDYVAKREVPLNDMPPDAVYIAIDGDWNLAGVRESIIKGESIHQHWSAAPDRAHDLDPAQPGDARHTDALDPADSTAKALNEDQLKAAEAKKHADDDKASGLTREQRRAQAAAGPGQQSGPGQQAGVAGRVVPPAPAHVLEPTTHDEPQRDLVDARERVVEDRRGINDQAHDPKA